MSLTTPSLDQSLAAGDEVELSGAGSWSGNNLPNEPFLQLQDSAGKFTLPRPARLADSKFSFAFESPATLLPGVHTGTLTVRACKDEACAEAYAGAVGNVAYRLNVTKVPDWATFQGNAAHTGYVPVTLNPAKFRQAWTWSRQMDDPIGGINSVVAADGKVFVTKDVYFGEGVACALDEANGTVTWHRSLGSVPAMNPPAVADGRLYFSTTGHQDTFLWTLDAATGAFVRKSQFEGQWPNILAPTIYDGQAYVNGGYYGGQVYAFSLTDGSLTKAWSTAGDDDMSTPAVDADHVYYYTGSGLQIWSRRTHGSVAFISDPFATNWGYSYHAAPALGSRQNVVAFAGSAFSGRASANVEQFEDRVLSSFNVASKSFEWATSSAYKTAPAIAEGVIYAAGGSPLTLDALDEATGRVLWSWKGGNGDASFHRNIIVTRNLLFVSTDRAVYAVDLKTHLPVWSYPEPGMLALSASRMLYIATGARESNGKLVAIKLN